MVIDTVIDWIWGSILAAVTFVFDTVSEIIVTFIEAYGIWAYIAGAAIKGLGLLVGPDEILTPTYVVAAATSPIEVAIIAAMGAATITFTNFLLYLGGRFAADYFAIGGDGSHWWRFVDWLCSTHGRISMVFLRLLPVVNIIAAVPAGMANLKVRTFFIYSFIGFFLFEAMLGYGAFYGESMGVLTMLTVIWESLYGVWMAIPV